MAVQGSDCRVQKSTLTRASRVLVGESVTVELNQVPDGCALDRLGTQARHLPSMESIHLTDMIMFMISG